MRRLIAPAVVALAWPAIAAAQQEPVPTFGTTVVIPGGLRGQVYHIKGDSTRLPKFESLKKPRGTIYTTSLDVPPQHFRIGFPGVTKRFEWFAIDYTGKFWIAQPGMYQFLLRSDDGARLYIDDQLIADNDGVHSTQDREASLKLAGGIHSIRVSYFQGPRDTVALELQIAGPGEKLRAFSTDEFRPPPNPETWVFPAAVPDTKPDRLPQ